MNILLARFLQVLSEQTIVDTNNNELNTRKYLLSLLTEKNFLRTALEYLSKDLNDNQSMSNTELIANNLNSKLYLIGL